MHERFHIGVLPDRPAVEVAQLAEEAERLGFGGIWVADSQSLFRDAWMTLALAAERTARMLLAPGVANVETRHPTVLAGMLATLDEQSDGRVVFGVGVGESAVRNIGLPPTKLGRFEEVSLAITRLVAGETVTIDGSTYTMHLPPRTVPLVFASSGPRSLRTAGRSADGVLFQVGADVELARYALETIDAGAREAGRDPAEIRRYMRLACSVDIDEAVARQEVSGYAAAAGGTVYSAVPRERLPEDLAQDLGRMKEHYDYAQHASATAAHRRYLTDRIIDGVAIAGTPEDAVPRFQELLDLGVETFVLPMTGPEPMRTIRLLAADVIPKLR